MNEQKTKTTAITPSTEYNDLNKEIVFCASSARDYAIRMALALKRMRDQKHYLSAGFQTFDDYTTSILGIKERQAYNYITIAEKHSEEFLHSNAKLGVTKLLLLAEVPEEQKENLANTAEDATVKELKEEIKKLNQQHDDTVRQLQKERIDGKKLLDEVRKEKDDIKKELMTIKLNPPKPVVKDDTEKTIKIQELEKDLSEKVAEISALEKKIALESNVLLSEFKIRFNQFQETATVLLSLLEKMPDTDKQKCKNALLAVVDNLREEL